jgi:hypothetical protein
MTHMLTTRDEMGRYDCIRLAEKDDVSIIVAVTATLAFTATSAASSSDLFRQLASAQEALNAEVERKKLVVFKESSLNAVVLHCFEVASGGTLQGHVNIFVVLKHGSS